MHKDFDYNYNIDNDDTMTAVTTIDMDTSPSPHSQTRRCITFQRARYPCVSTPRRTQQRRCQWLKFSPDVALIMSVRSLCVKMQLCLM